MSSVLILLLAISATIISYYLLCLVLTRAVISYYNKVRVSPDFNTKTTTVPIVNPIPTTAPIEDGTKPTRLIIGGTAKKFDFVTKTPLKAFNNAYDRTIHAIEDQKFEDWLDAIEKIYKMLKKDFFGTTKKFFKFLLNISKPVEKDDFEVRMARLNAQRQQMEVDKMVNRIQDAPSNDTLRIDQPVQANVPTVITKIGSPLIPSTQRPLKSILVLKSINDQNELALTTQEVDEEVEVSEFEKVEQRLLSKLKESGVGNYDLWLDLADLYVKNNSNQKASEIYSYVAKNAKDKNREKAINGIIGLD
jgi:hypothetical protein